MQQKAPDTRIYQEITELNREFLRLIIRCPREGNRPIFGLDPNLVDRIAGLTPVERGWVASAPCLLAELRSMTSYASAVADGAHCDNGLPTPYEHSTAVFAATLLTYLWQAARANPIVTNLCVGLDRDVIDTLNRLTFARIRQQAEDDSASLQARLAGHPCFWSDLLRSVAIRDRRIRSLSRLTILQLTVAQRWPRTARRSTRSRI